MIYRSIGLYQDKAEYMFDLLVRANNPKKHTVEIHITVKKYKRSKDSQVWVDGFEPECR